MSLPHVALEGGLVADPDLAFSSGGKPWVRMRVACNDTVRDDSGKWVDGPATFVQVVCFGKVAENIAESTVKGDRVAIVGRLQQRDYETSGGESRSVLQVVADDVAVSVKFRPALSDRVRQEAAPDTSPTGDPWG